MVLDKAKNTWPVLDDVARLPVNEVLVFAVPFNETGLTYDAMMRLLPAEEQQRAERIQFDRPRRQFVATRAALRTLVGRLLSVPPAKVELTVDAHGKPHLENGDAGSKMGFNVAHSGELGLIAMALGCDVGVDVEAMREVTHLERIARRYFHASESEAVEARRSFDRARAFLRCWTGKEAVVKSLGMGLTESLSRFCVPIVADDGIWIDVPSQNAATSARVWLQSLALEDEYLAAVACVGEQRRAGCFTFRW